MAPRQLLAAILVKNAQADNPYPDTYVPPLTKIRRSKLPTTPAGRAMSLYQTGNPNWEGASEPQDRFREGKNRPDISVDEARREQYRNNVWGRIPDRDILAEREAALARGEFLDSGTTVPGYDTPALDTRRLQHLHTRATRPDAAAEAIRNFFSGETMRRELGKRLYQQALKRTFQQRDGSR